MQYKVIELLLHLLILTKCQCHVFYYDTFALFPVLYVINNEMDKKKSINATCKIAGPLRRELFCVCLLLLQMNVVIHESVKATFSCTARHAEIERDE